MKIKSEQVLRNVCMASVLEPIPEKVGCTTRKKDLKTTARLEYFIIAGVNIGWDFYKLAERIKKNGYKQPKMIFDVSYKAQNNSFNNRTGRKINFGIIELFVPIKRHGCQAYTVDNKAICITEICAGLRFVSKVA